MSVHSTFAGGTVGVPPDPVLITDPVIGDQLLWNGSAWVNVPVRSFDVRTYGAVADGLTDDTDAIQLAIDAATAAGGGVVTGGLHSITDTLTVRHSNVRLDFGMQASGASAVESGVTWTPFVVWAPEPLFNGLVWDGVDGGTMVSITPDWANGNPLWSSLTGVGFRGNLIAGRGDFSTAAGTGLYVSGVTESVFEHINVVEFKSYGVRLFAENRANGTFSPCVYQNRFGKITGRQVINSGKVLDLDGGSAANNCYYNTFDEVVVYHDVGVGIRLGWCDHNIFNAVHLTRPSAAVGTADGLLLAANGSTDNMVPKWNVFNSVSVDFTSVKSENGSTAARSGQGNQIYQYTCDQGTSTVPVVGANSTLFWNSNKRAFSVKNTGDFAIVPLEFGATNVPANATVTQMGYGQSASALMTERMSVIDDCYLYGLSVRGTTTTNGLISFYVTIGGVQQTGTQPFLTNLAAGAILTYTKNAVPPTGGATLLSAGDAIGVEVVTNGAFLPTTNQYKAIVWLAVPIK